MNVVFLFNKHAPSLLMMATEEYKLKLIVLLQKFYDRHHDLVDRYDVSISQTRHPGTIRALEP